MVTVPAAWPVTTPAWSTVATVSSLLLQLGSTGASSSWPYTVVPACWVRSTVWPASREMAEASAPPSAAKADRLSRLVIRQRARATASNRLKIRFVMFRSPFSIACEIGIDGGRAGVADFRGSPLALRPALSGGLLLTFIPGVGLPWERLRRVCTMTVTRTVTLRKNPFKKFSKSRKI